MSQKEEIVVCNNGMVFFNDSKPFLSGIRKVFSKARDMRGGGILAIINEANRVRNQ